ncbi:MAG: hypothetical protein RLZZ253_573, partial [Verrucomicrobiota bacterium]
MVLRMKRTVPILILGSLFAWGTPRGAEAQPAEIRKSLARIVNSAQEPNYRSPWVPGQTGGGTGTGWVVSKDRLLTNAHVVSNARFLTVEKENDPKKYVARVEHIAH